MTGTRKEDKGVNKSKRRSKSRKKESQDITSASNASMTTNKDKPQINVQIFFILLLVSVITTFYLLTFSNQLTSNIQTARENIIQFQVEITSERYRESYTKGNKSSEDCTNESSFPGLSNSTIFVSKVNGVLLGDVKLGNATSFNYSKCSFQPLLMLKGEFTGGEVNVYVKFPFVQSEVYTVDLGTEPPYQIDLDFNLS